MFRTVLSTRALLVIGALLRSAPQRQNSTQQNSTRLTTPNMSEDSRQAARSMHCNAHECNGLILSTRRDTQKDTRPMRCRADLLMCRRILFDARCVTSSRHGATRRREYCYCDSEQHRRAQTASAACNEPSDARVRFERLLLNEKAMLDVL